jgi:hypothetical protein
MLRRILEPFAAVALLSLGACGGVGGVAHVVFPAPTAVAGQGAMRMPAAARTPTPAATPTPAPTPTATPQNPNWSYFSLYAPKLHITSLTTTLTVPPKPPGYGFISLWPGLDNVEAISAGDNILHQPITQWGGNCTYPDLPRYGHWLAEAFYYSQAEDDSGQHGGCNGGNVIDVKPSDTLTESIAVKDKTWNQIVTDNQSGESSTYTYSAASLGNQFPDRVNFDIEIWNTSGFNNHIPAVVFTDSSITADQAFPSCKLTSYTAPSDDTTTGKNSASAPTVSNSGKTCSYKKITLYPVSKFMQPMDALRVLVTHRH